MTYCVNCNKPTNNYHDVVPWNTLNNMVYRHCDVCGGYKDMYIQLKSVKNDSLEGDNND